MVFRKNSTKGPKYQLLVKNLIAIGLVLNEFETIEINNANILAEELK